MKKEVKIGIIMILVIIFFIWGFNFLKGKNVLSRTTNYLVEYNNINGLAVSNGVFIKGFKVGIVSNIKINDDGLGNLVVTITVKQQLKIPKGSIARITNLDLMGSKGIELVFATGTSYCIENDTIKGDVEASVAQQIEPIKAEVENLLRSMDTLVSSTAMVFDERSIMNLRKSIANINLTTSELALNSHKLATIFNNLEIITENLKDNNKMVMYALNNVSNISDSLAKANLKTVVDQTNNSLIQVQHILSKVNSGDGTIGLLLNNDSLYNNLNEAALNLNVLSRDIKENPKKYVNFSIFGNKKQ
jgi:phospholipid/cholesterol/gamma-HCH transport system substrate-binding protein